MNQDAYKDLDELHQYIQSLEHMLSTRSDSITADRNELSKMKEKLVVASAIYKCKCEELNINPDGKIN